ncbi:hypothetical protein QTG54_005349 [Skeletonema marinoi]|uniref:Uncharacterized protein n=1 Tax=Skeletonema marinoi TaxID=267567 RepID=A0AAD8YE32_9STRA|nr:hypothetical protein QTG54_005349 [Skeletonema marinoi]
MKTTRLQAVGLLLPLLLLIAEASANIFSNDAGITFNQHRRSYAHDLLKKLRYGSADTFSFGRFQSPHAIDKAMSECRSAKSFKRHSSKDGKEGYYCSTRLGGDWVLAESKQVAKDCVPAEVLAAYLDGSNQKKWNEDKVLDINIARSGSGLYRQDMVLKPQRVLTGKTTIMRYTQKICVDKVGNGNYNAFVELDTKSKSNTKLRPFHILKVNVGLEQVGNDVHIYAAGIMKVNRKIVPNLLIFDASGIAGAMAGKGTLWLSKHFQDRSTKIRNNRIE